MLKRVEEQGAGDGEEKFIDKLDKVDATRRLNTLLGQEIDENIEIKGDKDKKDTFGAPDITQETGEINE